MGAGTATPGNEPLEPSPEPAEYAGASAPALVLLDPALSEEQREGMVQALGLPVRSLDPTRIDAEPPQPGDLGVVVARDLLTLAGIDAVEHLRRKGCGLPIALACAEATRALVRAAQRAGATTVIGLPYDAEEIRRRLPLPAAGASPGSARREDPADSVSS